MILTFGLINCMRLLSWDVGIVNLAYCLIDVIVSSTNDTKTWEIIDWGCIDIVNKTNTSSINKHDDVQPSSTLKCSLCTSHKKKNILYTHKNIFYCSLHKPKGSKKHITNTKQISIDTLTESLVNELDKLKDVLLDVDIVLIENQPSLKNPKMKTISSCVYDYFLIRGKVDKKRIQTISFISATNKLKTSVMKNESITLTPEMCSSKYAYRKKLGKLHCEELLSCAACDPKWMTVYNSHKKKDDLSDCLLQGIYYIETKL